MVGGMERRRQKGGWEVLRMGKAPEQLRGEKVATFPLGAVGEVRLRAGKGDGIGDHEGWVPIPVSS